VLPDEADSEMDMDDYEEDPDLAEYRSAWEAIEGQYPDPIPLPVNM